MGGLDEGLPEVFTELAAGVELVHGNADYVAAQEQSLDIGEAGLYAGQVG